MATDAVVDARPHAGNEPWAYPDAREATVVAVPHAGLEPWAYPGVWGFGAGEQQAAAPVDAVVDYTADESIVTATATTGAGGGGSALYGALAVQATRRRQHRASARRR